MVPDQSKMEGPDLAEQKLPFISYIDIKKFIILVHNYFTGSFENYIIGMRGESMTIDMKDMINSILESISRIDYIHPEDLPGIDLYMDQVTTFMEAQLSSSKRHPEDKVLTKTMINNYAKNNLLPSPEKKKYTTEHMLLLIFIYYFKSILSISDIQTLLEPITQKFFHVEEGLDLSDIYSEMFGMEKSQIEYLKRDLTRRYNVSKETFQSAPEEDKDYLQLFSFICLLSFDVYIKKTLIEKLIDDMKEKNPNTKEKSKHKVSK